MSPLIILAPPRSYSSVVSAMLGQHPQMYGLPELNLFAGATLAELIEHFRPAGQQADRRWDGLLRVIAELFIGKQTEGTISLARKWVMDNTHESTTDVFEKIMTKVAPRIVVEKSITTIWNPERLERAMAAFPEARFLHISRHPRTHGESMTELMQARGWKTSRGICDHSTNPSTPDPQLLWLSVHTRIIEALKIIPEERKLHARGEDIVQNPDDVLPEIAEWLGLRTDAEAINDMKHPERSPYSCIGPDNAPMGSDHKFLEDPVLDPQRVKSARLEGRVPWRDDIDGFMETVKSLAVDFGYS